MSLKYYIILQYKMYYTSFLKYYNIICFILPSMQAAHNTKTLNRSKNCQIYYILSYFSIDKTLLKKYHNGIFERKDTSSNSYRLFILYSYYNVFMQIHIIFFSIFNVQISPGCDGNY